MQGGTRSFEELIARVKAGDGLAMAELVTTYQPEVLAFSRAHLGALLRPYIDSMDLVQSVHRTILLGLRSDKLDISSPEKLIGLAFTMVRRKIARQWQRHRQQVRFEQTNPNAGNLTDLLLPFYQDDLEPIEELSLRDQIDHILNLCVPADRALLRLRIEGLNTVEAARSLGLDPNIARVRLSRLRARLIEMGVSTNLS